ncbi:hypothetical protein E1J38_014180 [Seonamhaeicola sediminis]|uniref:Uncharacterized protein n=1 Tax=Seonamhaeicola sediminis TaxID=2528206 RepID=A0A562YAF5_9FLAO|nr:hypothetical protein [Seonamhaeicola sediminis]TWO31086.1 hypothetical protein E1J38_014180 [Seonamhaeicola sediminis]
MKLHYYCSNPSCKKLNAIKVKSTNRYDLKQEIGLEINDRCKHCSHHTKRHINRLHASLNYFIIIGGVVLAAIITILIWDLGFVSTLTGTIPIAIWMNEEKRASAFNKIMIRD